MNEILPSLIELFGSIAGIVIAFLVLLYDSAKSWIDTAKQYVIHEIKSSLNCKRIKSNAQLDKGHELYDKLEDECKHYEVNTENIDELLKILKSRFSDLRNKDILKASTEDAGTRAKDASHIENAHILAIEKSYNTFLSANKFYNDFPALSKISIGVPLLISFIFILLSKYHYCIVLKSDQNIFDTIIILIAFFGLYFVYHNSIKALVKLKEIDK